MFQFYLNFRSALRPNTNTKRKAKNVAEPGVEPSTCDALGGCSTDWAMKARYRRSLLATSYSNAVAEGEKTSKCGVFFFPVHSANNYSRVLKCEGRHIKRWRLLFWVPFLRSPPSRHPKALHPDVWRRHRSPSRVKSTLVKQVCKYCTLKCVTDDFAHAMVSN